MKRCPSCNRTYTDVSLNFCLEDGTPLISDAAPSFDPHATIRYTQPPTTSAPPPTETYRQEQVLVNQVPEMGQPRTPPSQRVSTPYVPQKKSNAVWWIVGGVLVVGIIGVGLIIMILVLASIGSNQNTNTNANSRVANRNANANRSTNTNNVPGLPRSFADDFSTQKWTTGSFQFGDIWYSDGEYHMRAKDRTYLVMYAPSDVYNTENATIRVTARNVGNGPASGYGLIVHGRKSPSNELEDYALLIFTGSEPQYQVIMHKNNNQTTLVPWTKSSAILSGSNANQLEVRIKGDQLSFYANGRYLNRITDSASFKRGVAGFYTSESSEVAFDNLEINR